MEEKRMNPTRNSEVLEDFVSFCQNEGKDLRFWQALAVWSEKRIIPASAPPIRYDLNAAVWRPEEVRDPWSWEGKER